MILCGCLHRYYLVGLYTDGHYSRWKMEALVVATRNGSRDIAIS